MAFRAKIPVAVLHSRTVEGEPRPPDEQRRIPDGKSKQPRSLPVGPHGVDHLIRSDDRQAELILIKPVDRRPPRDEVLFRQALGQDGVGIDHINDQRLPVKRAKIGNLSDGRPDIDPETLRDHFGGRLVLERD